MQAIAVECEKLVSFTDCHTQMLVNAAGLLVQRVVRWGFVRLPELQLQRVHSVQGLSGWGHRSPYSIED